MAKRNNTAAKAAPATAATVAFDKASYMSSTAQAWATAEKDNAKTFATDILARYTEIAAHVAAGHIKPKEDGKAFALVIQQARFANGLCQSGEPSSGDVSRFRSVMRIGTKAWREDFFANLRAVNAATPLADTIIKRLAGETLKDWKSDSVAPSQDWLKERRAAILDRASSHRTGEAAINVPKVADACVERLQALADCGSPLLANGAHEYVQQALSSMKHAAALIAVAVEKAEKKAKVAKVEEPETLESLQAKLAALMAAQSKPKRNGKAH